MQSLLRCLLLSVFSIVLVLTIAKAVNACSCGPQPTVLDSFERSDEVVIMKVLSVEKVENTEQEHYVDGVKSATLVVEKVFKGKLQARDQIVFGQGGGADCIWTFNEESVGDHVLLYLARPERFEKVEYLPSKEPGLWFAFGCGRSTGLANATEDLLYLENLSKVRGKTRISGSIGGGFRYEDLDVEGKKIKFIGSKKTYETRTDKDGVFEIYDLPPGKYYIEPETPAGWKIDPQWLRYSASVVGNDTGKPDMKSPRQVAVMLEPKKHASVDIAFTIDNSVRGRVLDQKGIGMPRVCVYLVRSEQDEWGPSDCTDEQGRFEITEVPEGEYVLVANKDNKPSSHEPFPRVFYPSVLERARAAVMNIGPGDRIASLDFVIPTAVDTVAIEGVLRYSDGKPVVDEWVKFKSTTRNDKVDGNVSEKTDAAGRFSFRVLKGLTGELSGGSSIYKGLFKNCPKVDELLAKSDFIAIQSNVITLATEHDAFEIELTLPFPKCQKARE